MPALSPLRAAAKPKYPRPVGDSWRVFVICSINPVAHALVDALRELGHEPVALLGPRRPADQPPPPHLDSTASSAPQGLDLLFVRDKHGIEPLVRAYEPDLLVCWGFPWKIPAAALVVPRLGSINHHPALLPRHRGPVPLAWAIRDGLGEWGSTWHYMDAELDTGNLLSQASLPIDDDDTLMDDFAPKLVRLGLDQLPRVLERVAAGDPGDPQDETAASWAGHFVEDEYARVDWSRPAREVHDQVRAWHLTFGLSGIRAPVAELDGRRVVLLETRLRDPGDGARRVECGDGPLWIVRWEDAESSS
jgi:methionyl-tRNA formyltransferase